MPCRAWAPEVVMMKPNEVYIARAAEPRYGPCPRGQWPEIPQEIPPTQALATLRSLFYDAGLDRARFGTRDWNPLGEFVQKGKRVVLKPNWVLHVNKSGLGLDCLITHISVIEAILTYVVKAGPSVVVVGDAPIQGCDFESLNTSCGFDRIAGKFSSADTKVIVKDFRRTIRHEDKAQAGQRHDCRPLDEFVLYDMGEDSALEDISGEDPDFRVTMYNPDLMKKTHGPGRHQYLIARDVIEADVVINVPKLKTHRKSCVTGALKNMVGINGHKEYLPHHRKGGVGQGGDCYDGGLWVKSVVEDFLDIGNRTENLAMRRAMVVASRIGSAVGKVLGADSNFEGAWHGNDTIWRTCLDLQRILHYGQVDGSLSAARQRTVLSITDALIAGEGEGPLCPIPVPLGLLTMGLNTAAIEWVHCILMGLDPNKIALVREAFADHRFPLTDFAPDDIQIIAAGSPISLNKLFPEYGRRFMPPVGWRGHCELDEAGDVRPLPDGVYENACAPGSSSADE